MTWVYRDGKTVEKQYVPPLARLTTTLREIEASCFPPAAHRAKLSHTLICFPRLFIPHSPDDA
jgi:hypothetical protein